jgi:hypothetical protein
MAMTGDPDRSRAEKRGAGSEQEPGGRSSSAEDVFFSEAIDRRTRSVRARGCLDGRAAAMLGGTVEALHRSGWGRIVLDLGGVQAVDGAGISRRAEMAADLFAADHGLASELAAALHALDDGHRAARGWSQRLLAPIRPPTSESARSSRRLPLRASEPRAVTPSIRHGPWKPAAADKGCGANERAGCPGV